MKSDTCENQRPEKHGTLKWGKDAALIPARLEVRVGSSGLTPRLEWWRA